MCAYVYAWYTEGALDGYEIRLRICSWDVKEREREKTSSTLGTGGARRVGVVCVWFVGEYNIYSFSEFIEMSRS